MRSVRPARRYGYPEYRPARQRRCPAAIVAAAGQVDILVANLSIPAPTTVAAAVTDEEWHDTFAALVHPLLQGRLKREVPLGRLVVSGLRWLGGALVQTTPTHHATRSAQKATLGGEFIFSK